MTSNSIAMASNLIAMASNLIAMASNLIAMASKLRTHTQLLVSKHPLLTGWLQQKRLKLKSSRWSQGAVVEAIRRSGSIGRRSRL